MIPDNLQGFLVEDQLHAPKHLAREVWHKWQEPTF